MSEDGLACIGWLIGLVAGALLALGSATLLGADNPVAVFALGAVFGLPMSLLGIAIAVRMHPDCKARIRKDRAAKVRNS